MGAGKKAAADIKEKLLGEEAYRHPANLAA